MVSQLWELQYISIGWYLFEMTLKIWNTENKTKFFFANKRFDYAFICTAFETEYIVLLNKSMILLYQNNLRSVL